MQTSTYLARLIGPIALVAALTMFINRDNTVALAREFLRSPALIYLAGLLSLTAGLAIVLSHNVWTADWRVLITIFGWLAVIGGAVRIALPNQTRSFGERMLASPMALTVGGAFWLLLGALLCFFGYFR